MIDNFNGAYILTCDVCGKEHPETFSDFYDAIEEKKNIGWKRRRVDFEWEDVCDECLRIESEA